MYSKIESDRCRFKAETFWEPRSLELIYAHILKKPTLSGILSCRSCYFVHNLAKSDGLLVVGPEKMSIFQLFQYDRRILRGCIKFPRGGGLSSLLGKNIKFGREQDKIEGVGKNIKCIKRGKGKRYHLPLNIKAVGKNIKWGREKGDGNFGEEN